MTIAQNLENIKTRIRKAGAVYGVACERVEIIAVSKFQPAEKIEEALAAGHCVFGENRVQEAQQHWVHLRAGYPDLRLHLIGPLQTNKAADAVALFDMIHTLDREKLARVLRDEMAKQERYIPCLVQVNTGEEPQKAGIAPHELEDFLGFVRNECGIEVRGLMCIPPVDDAPALHFAFLRDLARQYDLPELSMGMSSDYEQAAVLGARYVRIGTAIFGDRG